ncbi:MAG: hypothetical protein EU548_09250 [Promethearchaeota archaeon]|nr:MAG: hypothetical protein EU548_09250 [Candidatus Lokiarchaeota archaeon]
MSFYIENYWTSQHLSNYAHPSEISNDSSKNNTEVQTEVAERDQLLLALRDRIKAIHNSLNTL